MKAMRSFVAAAMLAVLGGCGDQQADAPPAPRGQEGATGRAGEASAMAPAGVTADPSVTDGPTGAADAERDSTAAVGGANRDSASAGESAHRPGYELKDGVLTISARDLTRMCVMYPGEVQDQWNGKPIQVTGVVQSIEPNRMEYDATTPRLEFHHRWTLEGYDFTAEASTPIAIRCDCVFDPSEPKSRETLAGIRVGQTVTVSGLLWDTPHRLPFRSGIDVNHASIIASQPAPQDAPPPERLLAEADLQVFVEAWPGGQAALKACNTAFSEAWTEEGTLKPEILSSLRKLPTIEELWVTQDVSASGLRELATLESIRALKIFRFAETVTADDLAVLSALQLLRSLEMSRMPSHLLSALPQLTGLRSLTFRKNFGDTADLPPLRGLNGLESLEAVYITNADLSALAGLNQLRSLTLSATEVTGEGFDRLAAELPELINLELVDSPLSEAGSRQIGEFSGLKRLVVMVTGTKISQLGDLSFLSKLPELQVLRLRGSLAPGCGRNLAVLSNLQSLAIESAELTNAEVVALASTGKPRLKVLRLRNCPVGDEAVAAVLRQELPYLVVLDLEGTQVGDETLKTLSAAAPPRLEVIDVSGTKVTDSGIAELKKLPAIRDVSARDTAVSDAALSALFEE